MPDQMRKWSDIVKGWLGGKKQATDNPRRTGGAGQGGSPATREQRRAVKRSHAPDRLAIPETGEGSGAELRFLLHAVPADELATFPREHAHRGLSDSEEALKSFKGRLRAYQHGMKRTDRSRTELIKCGTLCRGIRVLPLAATAELSSAVFTGIGRCRSPEKLHIEADEVENLVLVARRDQLPKQPILLARLSPHLLRFGRVVPVLPRAFPA